MRLAFLFLALFLSLPVAALGQTEPDKEMPRGISPDKEAQKKAEQAGRLIARGEVEKALALAREAVAADPGNPQAHYVLGLAHEAKGDLESAESEYKQMGLAAPESLREISLARLYLRQGRIAEAEQEARRAIAKNRWVPQPHLSLGAVMMRKKDYAGAIAAFSEAVKLSPQDWSARLSLADAFRLAGRWDEALTQYSQAQAMRPDHPEVFVGRGQVWERMGRPNEAIAAYEKALEVAREDVSATHVQHRLARLYLAVTDLAFQKPQRALELATAAAEATEFRDAAILETLAEAHERAGNRDKAHETREKLKRLKPPINADEHR